MTLEYKVREPLKKTDKTPLIMMLHGYGADMNDLFSLASELPDEALIISPQAPHRLPWGGYCWWNLQQSSSGLDSDMDQAKRAIDLFQKFLDEVEQQFEYDHTNTVLLGFSQGGMVSYSIAFHRSNSFKGILALSSYLMPALLPEGEPNGSMLPSFFISHGTEDPVLPIEGARKSREYLLNLGATIEYHEYPMAHGINPDNLRDARAWVDQLLSK